MKGDHIYFRRVSTGYLIRKLRGEYSSVFRNNKYMNDINTYMYKDICTLNTYINKNISPANTVDYTTLEKMLEITKKGDNLFDHSIYYLFEKYKKFLEDYPFIDYMLSSIQYGNISNFNSTLCDLFKYHKIRINMEHYMPEKEEEQVNED
jgi:hypothetical protein